MDCHRVWGQTIFYMYHTCYNIDCHRDGDKLLVICPGIVHEVTWGHNIIHDIAWFDRDWGHDEK